MKQEKSRAPITERQQEVLHAIKNYRMEFDYSPSRLELANMLDIMPNAVSEHLKALKKKGYIKITPRIARGITLL